jgi:F420-dependent methylenetetrahydromethanopterin dehydrogenase
MTNTMPVVAVTQGAAAGLPVAAASNQRCIENKRRKAPYHHETLHVAQRVSQSPMPACIARSEQQKSKSAPPSALI